MRCPTSPRRLMSNDSRILCRSPWVRSDSSSWPSSIFCLMISWIIPWILRRVGFCMARTAASTLSASMTMEASFERGFCSS